VQQEGMKKRTYTTDQLEQVLRKFNLSRSYVFLLSTGRRTPSMKLASRIMQETGIKPEVWIELNRQYQCKS
jgi:plasmid maintenance system antidote protein VapI